MGDDEQREAVDWVPLSRRGKPDEDDWNVLYDGIPEHADPALKRWAVSPYSSMNRRQERLAHLLRDARLSGTRVSALGAVWDEADETERLDIVDGTLHLLGQEYEDERDGKDYVSDNARILAGYFWRLENLLSEASCVLTPVHEEDGRWSLGRRVSEEEEAAFDLASSTDTTAAGHLRAAWAACFRREPDPATAYSEAVLAVEAAVGRVLTPRDGRPSLGKVIGHLEEAPDAYTLAGLDRKDFPSQGTVVAMLQTMQRNNRRHARAAGQDPDPVAQEEAEAVVFLAVTLVRWFEQDLVRKIAVS